MSAPHPAGLPDAELLKDCTVTRLRRSGPGGQHRNKVETAVRIVHMPTGVTAEASERRSQEENRRAALRRLRGKLSLEVRMPLERTAPSSAWSARCHDGRIRVSGAHPDFPALLAEALDTLQHFEWDVPAAAGFLGCTPSQLTKFLRKESGAFELVNRNRRELGLGVLK
jgi:hypothetical protein